MELSAITKEYNVPLTRSERNLLSQLPATASTISDDRYKQQMKTLADTRAVVSQLPDRQASERQRRMEKAAMLKERLKMLRQMIPFFSPSAAKSLKSEMKQISAQIASLSGGSGAGGGAGAAVPTAEADAATPESVSETASKVDAVPSSETAEVDDGTQQKEQAASDNTLERPGVKNAVDNSQDRQFKEAVEELKNLYKAVLEALKRKQLAGRGGEQLARHAPHLRVYLATSDNTNSVAVKA